jgi:hypothetical protein
VGITTWWMFSDESKLRAQHHINEFAQRAWVAEMRRYHGEEFIVLWMESDAAYVEMAAAKG